MEAIEANAYNSGVTAKEPLPTVNSPCEKPGRGIPPRAKGPITTPAISSPRTCGILTFFANFPKIFTAKRITPSCKAKTATISVIDSFSIRYPFLEISDVLISLIAVVSAVLMADTFIYMKNIEIY